jgi:ribose-phosphate pyrophosphokinase
MIISGSSNPDLAKAIAKNMSVELVMANTSRFNDQEFNISIEENLNDQRVIIVQSTSNPSNDYLIELFLLANIAKRSGSKSVSAVIPYFGYARQDVITSLNRPIAAKLMMDLVWAAGIEKIITIDPHSDIFAHSKIHNLYTAELFGQIFNTTNNNYIVVAPDVGSVSRAAAFAKQIKSNLVVIEKSRSSNGIYNMRKVIGQVEGKDCIIIDDILDTGSTVCCAADLLQSLGAKSIKACITHGVFSHNSLDKLSGAGVGKLYITDTIKHNYHDHFITTISVSKIIVEALQQL